MHSIDNDMTVGFRKIPYQKQLVSRYACNVLEASNCSQQLKKKKKKKKRNRTKTNTQKQQQKTLPKETNKQINK